MRIHSHRRAVALAAALLAALATAVAVPATARAAARDCTITWVAPGNGSWSRPTNWSPARRVTADDDVCLPTGTPRRRIAVDVDQAASRLFTGDAVLVIAAGATLTVDTAVADGETEVDGPGAWSTHYPTVESGASLTLSNGIALSAWNLLSTGPLHLRDHATAGISVFRPIGDVDGDASTSVHADWLVGDAQTTVDVPLSADQVDVMSGRLTVPQLAGVPASGTARLGYVTVWRRSTLVLPHPIKTLVSTSYGVTVEGGASLLAATTGDSALATLQHLRSGTLIVASDQDLTAPLTVDSGFLAVTGGVFAVPALSVSAGSQFALGRGATVRLAAGGDVTSNASVAGTRTRMDLTGGTVAGGIVQNDADAYVGSTSPGTPVVTVDGDWTSAPNALLSLATPVLDGTDHAPSTLHVHGDATLRGRLSVRAPAETAPVGTRAVLVEVDGRLRAGFGKTTAPPGWTLSTTAHAIVATYTG